MGSATWSVLVAFGGWLGRLFIPQKADFEALAELARKDVQALLARIEKADARYEAMAERVLASERTMRDVEAKLRRCRRQDRRKGAEIRRLEAKVAAQDREIGALRQQNADQQRQIDETRKTMGVPTGAATP